MSPPLWMTSMIYLFYVEISFVGKSRSTVSFQWTKLADDECVAELMEQEGCAGLAWWWFFPMAAEILLSTSASILCACSTFSSTFQSEQVSVCDKLPSHLSLMFLSFSFYLFHSCHLGNDCLYRLSFCFFHFSLVKRTLCPYFLQLLHLVPLWHFPAYFGVCSDVLHLHWWVE